MRFTLDLDRFFDFLTRFSLIFRFQPILPLQNSRGPKTVIFWLFAVFSTLGNDCEGDFELTFDFPTEDPTKHKRLTAFDAKQTCFWRFFETFQRAFRTDMTYLGRENMQKGDFLNFVVFSTLGTYCKDIFWTHIRFSHRRPGKTQAIDSIWCPIDVFLTAFEALQSAFRADMQKSKKKYGKNVGKGQKIKKFNIIFYRCRNTFYEVYTWFGPFFRLFDPFFFNF